MKIFQSTEQNEQLARDAQAILDAATPRCRPPLPKRSRIMRRVEMKQGAMNTRLCGAEFVDQLCGECCNEGITACPHVLNYRAPATQVDAPDGAYEFAAKVIELFDDATLRADHMLDAGECASVIRALKSTEIAAIAAKVAL